jgi:hypothetical protein
VLANVCALLRGEDHAIPVRQPENVAAACIEEAASRLKHLLQ